MADQPSENLDLEIKRLERDKKLEEVRQLKSSRKAAWIAPAALAALVPIAVAFGGFAWKEFKDYNEGYRALAEIDRIRAQTKDLQAQKDSLNMEVVALLDLRRHYAEQAKELAAKLDERQGQLDIAFLRARFASDEARYALSHVGGSKESALDALTKRLTELRGGLPADLAGDITRAIGDLRLALDMNKVSHEVLDDFGKTLDLIPASDWARALKSAPAGYHLAGRNVMSSRGPGGIRYYDVDAGRFLTAEETKMVENR